MMSSLARSWWLMPKLTFNSCPLKHEVKIITIFFGWDALRCDGLKLKRSGNLHQSYNTLNHDISSLIIIFEGRNSHIHHIKQSNNMYIIQKFIIIGMLPKCKHAYRYRPMFRWQPVCKVIVQMMCTTILKLQPRWMKLDMGSSYLFHLIVQVQF